MSEFYKLDENKNAIPCSMEEWAKQLEEMRIYKTKRVALSEINNKRISTVWMGLNHQMDFNDSKPLIFETMVFDENNHDIYCNHYATWQEAEVGHEKAIQWVKDGCKDE